MDFLTRRQMLVIGLAAFGASGWTVLDAQAQSKGLAQSPLRRLARPTRRIQFETQTPPGRVNASSATRLVNKVRVARGRPKLSHSGVLQRVARHQAQLMAKRDEMSHKLGAGLSLKERARRAGYRGKPAENLARKYETLEETLLAWLHSPSHRTSLLWERYRYFGLAVAKTNKSANSKFEIYWAIVLGT